MANRSTSSTSNSAANKSHPMKSSSSISNTKQPSNKSATTCTQNDEEMRRKIRKELLQFMMEENLAAQSSKAQADSNAGEGAPTGLTLPKTVHDTTIDNRRQQQEQLIKQIQESKDFFRVGEVAESRFLVTLKIKDGGFGQVYKVIDKMTQEEMALKVEKNTSSSASNENLEGIVLKAFQGNPNCPKMCTMGATPRFTYIAMQLLGENLSDIRRSCTKKPARLSISAAYRTTLQCLRAVEGLHKIGYLHRDVKPSNFAVGREPKVRHIVYMLDFGLCRRYYQPDGTLKKARENIGFRGTVRYASLAAHAKRDLGRCDDLWSLFYTFVELITGQLPWRKTNDKEVVAQLKRKYSHEVLCQVFPPEVSEFCRTIQKLGYYDTPDYDRLNQCLSAYLPKIKANMDDPYDWQMCDCLSLVHWEPPK